MPNSQQLYYVNASNGAAGPYTLGAIHTMVRNGQLPGNVQVCQLGTQYWMPLPPISEDFFKKVIKWVENLVVNGLFVNSEVLELRVSFSGRIRRRNCILTQLCNYGLFVLQILVIVLVSLFADWFYHEFRYAIGKEFTAVLAWAFGILVSLPFVAFACWLILVSISTFVRRLHDIGLSGWFYFFSFIPYIGSIWPFIICCIDSVPGANQYGENPKGIGGSMPSSPNPQGGVGMPTVPVMPPPPYPTANQTRPVTQMPIPSFPQPLATPASIPVCPPPPPVHPQVEVIQPPPPSPAFSHGVGSPTTQPPLVNQTPAALQQQVVSPPPVAPAGEAPQPPSPEVSVPGTKTMYFVQIDGAKQGPFEAQRIVQMIADGQISADTQVWAEGMTQWQPVRQVQLM